MTATTARFVPGTFVTLTSFLKHHPDFDGDLVVVHDGLSAQHRQPLAQVCPRVRFEPVSPGLRARLAALCSARPDFTPRLGQFYSLEAFRLRDYRKVLYYDSDVLFQASVADLFASSAALLCCGDGVFLRGGRRAAATFRPLPPAGPSGMAGAPAEAGVFERPFGTGFLLIDPGLVEEACYAELLALVSPETWRGSATWHTDQFILNRCFAGRQTLVSWTYDFALPKAAGIRAREGIDAGSAKVLHFAGPVKPWLPEAMLRWAQGDPDHKPLDVFRRWYDAYVACLAEAHLRNTKERLAGNRG